MKIISGKFKGSKLFLPQNKLTRPLKNIVKEIELCKKIKP